MAVGRLFASSAFSVFSRVAAGAWIPAAILTSSLATSIALIDPGHFAPGTTTSGLAGVRDAARAASSTDWGGLLVATLVLAYGSQFVMVGLVRFISLEWSEKSVRRKQEQSKAAHLARSRSGNQLESEARRQAASLKNFPESTSLVKTGSTLGNLIEKAELDAGSDFGLDYGVHASVLQALARRAGSDPTDGPRLEIETLVSSSFALILSALAVGASGRSAEAMVLAVSCCVLSYVSYRLSISAARRYVLAARTLVVLHIRELLELWGESSTERCDWPSAFAILNEMEKFESSSRMISQ